MSGGTLSVYTNFHIGRNDGAYGEFNMSGGTTTVGRQFFVGNFAGGTGEFNISDGTLNTHELIVGHARGDGTMNMTGGEVNATGFFAIGHGGTPAEYNAGEINQSGGSLTAGLIVRVGRAAGKEGTYNLSGDAEATFNGGVDVGHAANSMGTFNLDGGTMTTTFVGGHADAKRGVFNFNGGVLTASQDNATFMQGLAGDSDEGLEGARVLAGGAIIDNNGFEITIAQDLVGSANDGGLISRGSGKLTLSGAGNSYAGNTTIEAGTLVVNDPFFDELSTISLSAGAFLDLNFIGTNQVYGLIVDGVSQDVGIYSSGNTSYLLGDGSLNVIPEPTTFALLAGLLPLLLLTFKRRR